MTDIASMETDQRPIVVGIDGSEGAVAALQWAVDAARLHKRPLTVITVKNPMTFYGFQAALTPEIQAISDSSSQAVLDNVLTTVYRRTDPEGVTAVVREGNPAQVLIDASQEASLLVVGERGRGNFPVGSVTDRCVRHARCPVVVVR